MTEILLASQTHYHSLLSTQLQGQLAAVVEADVLNELEIRTEAQHKALVAEYGLPWQLEGAGGRYMLYCAVQRVRSTRQGTYAVRLLHCVGQRCTCSYCNSLQSGQIALNLACISCNLAV